MTILAATAAAAENSPRIKRRPPTSAEAEQIASDAALNDSLFRKGDIVATNRGFFLFRGIGTDGITNDFAPVPKPLYRSAR
jgi:hypothetical protein